MVEVTKKNFNEFMIYLRNNVNSNYEFLNPLLLCKTFQKKDVMMLLQKILF